MPKNNDHNFFCRVCGFDQGFAPWGEDNKSPTFDICDCCGVQFGYEDCDLKYVKLFRKNWIEKGAAWSFPKVKPSNWSLEEQMKQIPEEFK